MVESHKGDFAFLQISTLQTDPFEGHSQFRKYQFYSERLREFKQQFYVILSVPTILKKILTANVFCYICRL